MRERGKGNETRREKEKEDLFKISGFPPISKTFMTCKSDQFFVLNLVLIPYTKWRNEKEEEGEKMKKTQKLILSWVRENVCVFE